MKNKSRLKGLFFPLLFVFLSLPKLLSAQMTAIPHTYHMSTPHGNVPMTHYIYMPRYYARQGAQSFKYDYKIMLNNDSLVQSHVKIHIKDSLHYIEVKNGKVKTKIYPKDTKEIICVNYDRQMKGIPADTCWLFKTRAGFINAYTFIPEKESAFVTAIQKGIDGPIVTLTKENLLEMIADNPKAVKAAEKDNLMKALRIYNNW